MYSFISGSIVSAIEGQIVIENNGIGYEINVSANTLMDCVVGQTKQLFTYLQVKEDAMVLFGFSSQEEKSMFLKLITISGVGPKMALQVLSGLDLNSLIIAIASEDTKTLSKIKGLGKKTAERIILELREQVDATDYMDFPKIDGAVSSNTLINDALFALAALDFPKAEAYKAVLTAVEKTSKLEEVITLALKGLDYRNK